MYADLPGDVRTRHPYHMYDEIRAQPGAVGRSLALAERHANAVAELLPPARRVVLVGCGTSFHAAMGGAWLLRSLSRGSIDARAVGALEVAVYDPGLSSDDVVLAVTHSGVTSMTVNALKRAALAGARTVVVTGFPEKVQVASDTLLLPTGFPEERSWAHTASYTAALTTLAVLANTLAHGAQRMDLSALPEAVNEALELEEMAHRMAASAVMMERYREPARIVVIGGGPSSVTAREAVLKLLETSYVPAEAYELEFMLHGPLASVTAEDLCIILSPDGPSTERAAELARALRQIGVVPMVLAGEESASHFEDSHRLILPDMPDILSPIAAIVPLQLFSYYLAVGKGINPDLLRRDDERYRGARAQYS